jgi:hypothetical protein
MVPIRRADFPRDRDGGRRTFNRVLPPANWCSGQIGPMARQLAMVFARGERDDHGTVIPVDLIQADLWSRLAARSPEAWRPLKVEELKAIAIALPAAATSAAPRCQAMQ